MCSWGSGRGRERKRSLTTVVNSTPRSLRGPRGCGTVRQHPAAPPPVAHAIRCPQRGLPVAFPPAPAKEPLGQRSLVQTTAHGMYVPPPWQITHRAHCRPDKTRLICGTNKKAFQIVDLEGFDQWLVGRRDWTRMCGLLLLPSGILLNSPASERLKPPVKPQIKPHTSGLSAGEKPLRCRSTLPLTITSAQSADGARTGNGGYQGVCRGACQSLTPGRCPSATPYYPRAAPRIAPDLSPNLDLHPRLRHVATSP